MATHTSDPARLGILTKPGIPTEYYVTENPPAGPTYTEYAVGINYACECLIPKRPDAPFGSRTAVFPNKKAARANAAREALLWLGENGYAGLTTGADGTLVVVNLGGGKRKKGKGGVTGVVATEMEGTDKGASANASASADAAGSIVGGGKEKSFTARVNGTFLPDQHPIPSTPLTPLTDFCPLLSLSPPEYRLTASAAAPNMYSGAAYFVKDPVVVPGPVGEVRLVYGRKNAREACAASVWAFLTRLASERSVRLGVVAGDRVGAVGVGDGVRGEVGI